MVRVTTEFIHAKGGKGASIERLRALFSSCMAMFFFCFARLLQRWIYSRSLEAHCYDKLLSVQLDYVQQWASSISRFNVHRMSRNTGAFSRKIADVRLTGTRTIGAWTCGSLHLSLNRASSRFIGKIHWQHWVVVNTCTTGMRVVVQCVY